MSDHVVCPVCHSRNALDARACITCGAPLADARLPEEPEPVAAGTPDAAGAPEASALAPGFGLWADEGGDPTWGTPEDLGSGADDEAAAAAETAADAEAAAEPAEDAPAGGADEPEPAGDASAPEEEPVEAGPWGPLAKPAEPWPADAWPPGPGQVDDEAAATSGLEPGPEPFPGLEPVMASTPVTEPEPEAEVDPAVAAAAAAAIAESGGATISPAPEARTSTDAADAAWRPVSPAGDDDKAPKPGVCWNCGQKNSRGREFCKRCGQRLHSDLATDDETPTSLGPPVKGGRGKRAVAFVWTVLVLAVVVVVGVVAFGGFLPRAGGDEPSPTPASQSSPVPLASGGAGVLASPTVAPTVAPTPTLAPTPRPTPTPAPTPPPTLTPSPTPEPSPSPEPTRRANVPTPGAITTTASPRAPAPAEWSCKDAVSMRDPLDRTWVASGIYFADRGAFDRITVRLTPVEDGRGDETRVNVSIRRPDELTGMGLPQPAEGDVAVVIRLSDDMTLLRQMQVLTEKPAVRTLTATTATDGRSAIILGVAGKGCVSFQAPDWEDPSGQHTPFVDLTVDVQH